MTPTFMPLFMPALEAVLRAAESALHALSGAVRQHTDRWRRRRQANATYRSLFELDDHLLHDLGIDRSELQSIALHPTDPDRIWTRA